MSAIDPVKSNARAPDKIETKRNEALLLFPLESIQHLDRDNAIRCQQILGHGSVFGVWTTPRNWVRCNSLTTINLRERLIAFLPAPTQARIREAQTTTGDSLGTHSDSVLAALEEAVLWMTRYALLCRMGPVGLGKGKGRQLDTQTIAMCLYMHLVRIIALAVQRRLECGATQIVEQGFICELQADDVDRLRNQAIHCQVELKRMAKLYDIGLWQDAPAKSDFKGITTAVKGARKPPQAQQQIRQFQPLPDEYVAEMGSKVLWIIQNLGPNLLHLLDALPNLFADIDTAGSSLSFERNQRLTEYFAGNIWRDKNGSAIQAPPFKLMMSKHGIKNRKDYTPEDAFLWPPRNWAQIKGLSATLQTAHLWVTFMSTAGRQSELLSLKRDCVQFVRDGKPYAKGKTFKLVRKLDGDEREWVLPDLAVLAIEQQVRLVEVWERLAQVGVDALESDDSDLLGGSNHLWGSLGNGHANPEKALDKISDNLLKFAIAIDMAPKPGGINIHPHRFRKTIARLCALAITNSPRILMQVFGHKDIQMTLYYILTDKALAKEVETVARELRIMRCEEIINDIHAANQQINGLPYGGHGGPGSRAIAHAIDNHGQDLHRMGKKWDADSARELAVILTMNGETWTYVRPHVLCTKSVGEAGECLKGLGSPDASNCRASCTNRIEEKTARRDVAEIIPKLIEDFQVARDDNQLMLMADLGEQIRQNILRFEDIRAEWQANTVVSEVLSEVAA